MSAAPALAAAPVPAPDAPGPRRRAGAWLLGAVGLVELVLTVAGALAARPSVDLLGS